MRHQATVMLLLNWGADPDTQTNIGKTPLMIAAGYNDTEIIRLLLEHGATVWGFKLGVKFTM